jgi:hypothetical protein
MGWRATAEYEEGGWTIQHLLLGGSNGHCFDCFRAVCDASLTPKIVCAGAFVRTGSHATTGASHVSVLHCMAANLKHHGLLIAAVAVMKQHRCFACCYSCLAFLLLDYGACLR